MRERRGGAAKRWSENDAAENEELANGDQGEQRGRGKKVLDVRRDGQRGRRGTNQGLKAEEQRLIEEKKKKGKQQKGEGGNKQVQTKVEVGRY